MLAAMFSDILLLGEEPVRAGGSPQPRPQAGECRAVLQGECSTAHILPGFRGNEG